MRLFIKNRKGTAEVIGTIMFIVILLFFFTNVYLWHDAATKDGNQLYMKQIHSTFKIEQIGASINITANGGSDIVLSRLWIINGTNGNHLYADLNSTTVQAGTSLTINFAIPIIPNPSNQVDAEKQSNTTILVYFAPQIQQPLKCSVMNNVGVAESTTFIMP